MKAEGASPTDISFGRPSTPFTISSGNTIVSPYDTQTVFTTEDDDSTEYTISDTIEDGLKLGDTTYNSIFVGSNGYITFGQSYTSYNSVGISGFTTCPMIAGQFDDIDLGTAGTVYLNEDDANDIVTVTWYQVGYYETPTDGSGVNTFQIRLHGLGNGDFGIEIRYDSINWMRGMPADPGSYPTAGWTIGDGSTYGEVNDSGTADFITIEDESNINHPGVFAWNVVNGGVIDINTQIYENSLTGTFVGNLTASDADDAVTNLTFTLLDNDGGNFKICHNTGTSTYYIAVALGASLDYETSPNHQRQITVQAEDLNGNTGSAVLNITLLDQSVEFTNETIRHQQTSVPIQTSEWSVDISHSIGGTYHWWINTTPDVGNASGVSNINDIAATCPLSGLQPYTTYTVHVTLIGSNYSQNYTFTTGAFVGNSSWYNASWLNVTVESKNPRILWYDFQKCSNESFDGYSDIDSQFWVSKRNNMTETDNDTWYRFIVNVSSDQGWDNIEYINISAWHDNGSDDDVDGSLFGSGGYNRSGNRGGNRNFYLMYENVSGTAYYNLTYPWNNSEITIGGFSERNVSDVLGISNQTESRNISFCFKPGYQFRYAPGPGDAAAWVNDSVNCVYGISSGDGYDPATRCWESFDNPWSWNFNITVENAGERWEEGRYRSWVNDEFGIYVYTEIVSATNAEIFGAPGDRYSTNGSSWYNSNFNSGNSVNVTVVTRSNGNYSMTVNVSDLRHVSVIDGLVPDDPLLHLDNDTIWVRGGNRTVSLNFSDNGRRVIWLYGSGSPDGSVDSGTLWQVHEVNGSCKFTGEAGDDGLSEVYPDHYNSSSFRSINGVSHYVEFACDIPLGQIAGKYSTFVYYHLRTQQHP
jgi:hypothetical protein